MLVRIVFIICPTIILCQTIINSQSKDYCPGNAGAGTRGRTPRLQIRTVLVRCPNKGQFGVIKNRVNKNANLSISRTQDLLEFFGYDSDEPLLHSEVTRCRKKLIVTIQMANCGKTKMDDEYILIDQIYDPVWMQRIRLLNPIVIKLKQFQVEQAYGLNIQHIVNAEAREEVFNKNNNSFKGCFTSGLNPTCGYSYYHDEVIPNSEGFCCSCDALINLQRQPDTFGRPPLSPIAFTSREGNLPQGKLSHSKKDILKGMRRPSKNRIKRSLQESVDEIYSDFATKIKSFMIPKNLKESYEPYSAETQERFSRGSLRFSPIYYNIPPLEPARGFQKITLNYSDANPWDILYPEPKPETTPTNTPKNERNSQFNRILTRISAVAEDGRYPDDWHGTETFDVLPDEEEDKVEDDDKADGNQYMNKEPVEKVNARLELFPHHSDRSKFKKMPYRKNDYKSPFYQNKQPIEIKHSWPNNMVRSENKNNEEKCPFRSPFRNNYSTDTLSESQKENDQKSAENNANSEHRRKRKKQHIRSKRQISSSGNQVRGGQSCADRHTPANIEDKEAYHESAHCLRFSELWYNVYRLKSPFIAHRVDLRLFEKHSLEVGCAHWNELSKTIKHIPLGTFIRHVTDFDPDPSLVLTYTPLSELHKSQFCLDPVITTLLVPRPVPKRIAYKFPQIDGGPKEYLLVRTEDVSFDGEDCDRAGTSYRAFAKQELRCAHPIGTCLANQPLHLWQHDVELKKRGQPGKFFLENYAKLSNEPIKYHKEIGDYLTLDFTGAYQSVVEVELPIDKNGLVSPESTAQISEVYVDSTCEYQTRITIIVTNTGITSGAFFPRMKGCPPEIPLVWTENEGPLVYIAPQKIHRYRLSLYGKLPVARFHCSIEILNKKQELVATRRVKVQNFDRCVCMWHCLCACIASLHCLRCNHMSLEHYHAAGFAGALPVDTADIGTQVNEVLLRTATAMDFMKFFVHVYGLMIFMGFMKVLLGLIFPSISNLGLWFLFECTAKRLKRYKENYWLMTHIIRDAQGYPVTPAAKSRNVQILSKSTQVVANIFFFCILPGVVVLKFPRGCCFMFCFSLSALRLEVYKNDCCREIFTTGRGKYLARFVRRLQRVWRHNFWLPIFCFLNPFFLYSLCKNKDGYEGRKVTSGKSKAATSKHVRIKNPEGYRSGKGLQECTKEPDEKTPVNVFTSTVLHPQYTEDDLTPGSMVVKASDYPNLDKKTIRFVVKSVRKGFHMIMNEVFTAYKEEKQKRDLSSVLQEVASMKNKKLKDMVAEVTKAATTGYIRNKYGIVDKNSAIDPAQLKIQAEQVTMLIDQSFKELICNKLASVKRHES